MGAWRALIVLSLAQFLMVLDQAVMNVSISQLVDDFDTDITTIQGVITFYALVMATLMITGGRVGDIVGRRRTFSIGLVVYGVGSALTAVSWNVPTLLLGWSVLEGVGAAMVLPALVTLVAGNYEGPARRTAFGVIGGVSGVGIAAGPIVGGFFTTNLSWRWVFVGEVIVALVILATVRWVTDAEREGRRPRLDVVGSVLSALGLGLVVVAVLRASEWGWIRPQSSPIEPFGFALTPFVVLLGLLVLGAFVAWQDHRISRGLDPLVRLHLLAIPELRAGVSCFLSQNLILLGIFFTLPLYFQIVLGFDALETGIRMLPISIAMFVAASLGPGLTGRFGARRVVQCGFVILVLAAFAMLSTIDYELRDVRFGVALTVLGVGMGLIGSQLGDVVQSSVDVDERGEAGGLQYTSMQLGSAIGTALVGAVVLTALVSAFVDEIGSDDRVSAELVGAIEVEIGEGASFVPAEVVDESLRSAGVDDAQTTAVVDNYREAQLGALEIGLLLAGCLAALSLLATRHLPGRPAVRPP